MAEGMSSAAASPARRPAGEQLAHTLARACAVRWLGVLASVVAVVTANPAPALAPAGPWLITAGLAGFNLVAMGLLRRRRDAAGALVIPSVVVDFTACSGWMLLGADAPVDVRFIFFTAVAIEAAALLLWRGAVAVLVAFLAVHVVEYVERDVVYGYSFNLSSLALRSSAIAMVALFSGAVTAENERRGRELVRSERTASERRGLEHELLLLRQMTAVMSSALDLDAVLATVVRTAALMLAGDGADPPFACLLRAEGRLLVSCAEQRAGRTASSGAAYALSDHPLLQDTLRSRAPASGALTLVPVAPPDAASAGGIAGRHQVALAPLTVDGAVYGILLVGSPDDRPFEEASLRRLEAVSQLAALAVANARAHTRAKETAVTDVLTGLRNRRGFEQAFEQVDGAAFAFIAVDVDNLKTVNDEYGHEAGDELLRLVGRVLAEVLRQEDAVARIGGDEFAILLPRTGTAEAERVAGRIREALRGAGATYGTALVSAGVALGDPGEKPWTVWKRADHALYAAKRRGGDRAETAPSPHRPGSGERRGRLGRAVREVVERGRVDCAYQPIVHLATRRVRAVEALARPQGLAPAADLGHLFAAAHRIGLARELDWVRRKSSIAGATTLPPEVLLFVNTTASLLLDPLHPADQLLLLLREHGRAPAGVVLEITELERMPDLARLREVVAEYRSSGVRFAVDGVGEGCSSLALLTAVGPEFLKLAGSLTSSSRETRWRAAVDAAVAFARSSGSVVIAEGVETDEAVGILAEAGVDYGQGRLLGPPVRAWELPAGPDHGTALTGRPRDPVAGFRSR